MENRKPEKKKLLTGDTLPYLGDTLTLTVVREDRKSGRIKRVMNRLIMTVPYEADVFGQMVPEGGTCRPHGESGRVRKVLWRFFYKNLYQGSEKLLGKLQL